MGKTLILKRKASAPKLVTNGKTLLLVKKNPPRKVRGAKYA